MAATLAEVLRLNTHHLREPLFQPEVAAHLEFLAHRLPLTARAGFECRLGDSDPRVDLQQGIQGKNGEPSVVARRMAGLLAAMNDPVASTWQRISQFCAAWDDPDHILHLGISQVWLEWDIDAKISAYPIPSVFLELRPRSWQNTDSASVLESALTFLLEPEDIPDRLADFHRCLAACEAPARIDYAGVMLGRKIAGLRLNIQDLPLDDMLPFLERVGLPLPLQGFAALLEALADLLDAVVVCLDVGAQVYPRLGLECFLLRQPQKDPRWEHFMAELVRWGLCTPEKAAALLAWPGMETPPTNPAQWPDALMVESLWRPPEQFASFARRLSHIKLTYQPLHTLEAKGYFGFGHVWQTLGGRKVEPQAGKPTAGTATPQDGDLSPAPFLTPSTAEEEVPEAQRQHLSGPEGTFDLDGAIAKAANFIIVRQTQGGWWRDFHLPAGLSDEWVTGYIGATLAKLQDMRALKAAQRAWQALSRRTKPDGGWGYNGQTPSDADSITWGLRLAQALQVSASERARHAQEALRRHVREDGGIVTYAEAEPIRDFAAYPNQFHYGGWTDSHVCVTAAAAGLQDADIPCLPFLRQRQIPVGCWQSYWWEDDEYTTGLAAEALAQSGHTEDQERVDRAIAWAQQRVSRAGAVMSLAYGEISPFATAWAVRLLLLDDAAPHTRESLHRAVRWLLAQQGAHGSWTASARLRVPPPDVTQPQARAGGMTVVLDQNRLFTTATVLEALIKFRQSMESLVEIDTAASA